MEPINVFPDKKIASSGDISDQFIKMNIHTFTDACNYVHKMPYGYNPDRDDLMGLFKDGMGTCISKHAVIATLALELGLPVHKHIGIYAMNEALVTGTDTILHRFGLPHLPMVHCFLVCRPHRVDLTEGNANGKNGPVDEYLHIVQVEPDISGRDEYLIYRSFLKTDILQRDEFRNVSLKDILQAREEGLALLKANVR